MILERSKDQSHATLEEFYARVEMGGTAMLELIARLRALPDNRHVWGLTSHQRLGLLAHDEARSPWYVIVAALDRNDIYIEYLVPSARAPWPNAYMRGQAHSIDDALAMILVAMRESGGWASE